MDATAVVHPTDETLHAYGLGKLDVPRVNRWTDICRIVIAAGGGWSRCRQTTCCAAT